MTRPIVALGADIGYLPGSKEDKMMHWMQPIFDNLAFMTHVAEENSALAAANAANAASAANVDSNTTNQAYKANNTFAALRDDDEGNASSTEAAANAHQTAQSSSLSGDRQRTTSGSEDGHAHRRRHGPRRRGQADPPSDKPVPPSPGRVQRHYRAMGYAAGGAAAPIVSAATAAVVASRTASIGGELGGGDANADGFADGVPGAYIAKASTQQLIHEKVQMEAITYLRGRSIQDEYVVVDECQNLTPHEVKTIISRAGEGTKIVLCGDPLQIDNPYVFFGERWEEWVCEGKRKGEGGLSASQFFLQSFQLLGRYDQRPDLRRRSPEGH